MGDDSDGTTTFSAPDWVTAIGLVCSSAVAIVGYLVDKQKSRRQDEAQAQLERESREGTEQLQLKHLCDQAELKRVRQQISIFVGPLHRHGQAGQHDMVSYACPMSYGAGMALVGL
jgi:Flp pilus assembly protein TadB